MTTTTTFRQFEPTTPSGWTFAMHDHVQKKSGAAWSGYIVGFYRTNKNTEGYAVESEYHPGSVQIYPVAALELVHA